MTVESTASRKSEFTGVRYTLDDLQVFVNEASAEIDKPVVELIFDVDDERFRAHTTADISSLAASLPNKLQTIEVIISDGEDWRVSFAISNARAVLSVDGRSRSWVRGTFVGLTKNVVRHQSLLDKNRPTTFGVAFGMIAGAFLTLNIRHPLMNIEHPTAAESAQLQAGLNSDPSYHWLLGVVILGFIIYTTTIVLGSYVILKPPSRWLAAPEWIGISGLALIAAAVIAAIDLLHRH